MNDHKFNLKEIFEIAEQIERNGAAFYRQAALRFDDNMQVKNLLLELAGQEDEHEKIFSEIQQRVSKEDISVKDELTCQYLDAVAGQFVFEEGETEKELAEKMSLQDIFDIAIQKEKDSIIFYIGLKSSLISTEDKKAIDSIISEEQRHFVDLMKYAEILKYNHEIL